MIYLPTYEKHIELSITEKIRRDEVLAAVTKNVNVTPQDREWNVIAEAINYSIWVGYEAPNFVSEEITQNLISLVRNNPKEDFLLKRITQAPTIARLIKWAVEDSFQNARDYYATFHLRQPVDDKSFDNPEGRIFRAYEGGTED